MKRMRMLGCMLSLLLASAVLTACGDESSTDSAGTAELTQTTTVQGTDAGTTGVQTSDTVTTAEQTTSPASTSATTAGYVSSGDKQYDTAYLTLEKYLRACGAGDRDSLLSISNLRKLYDIAGTHAGPGVRYRTRLDAAVQTSLGYASAQIGKGTEAAELMQQYNESLPELEKALAAAASDPQKQAELSLTSEIRQPIEALYVFPVTCQTLSGETVSVRFFVSCAESSWCVDMGVIPFKLEDDRANALALVASDARRFFIALGNSLTEMNGAGLKTELADGLYYYRGADYGWGLVPETIETQADMILTMNIKARQNFADSEKCDQIAFAVNNGICKAVAIQRGSETDPLTGAESYYFGCYPNVLAEEDFGTYISIEDVLVHAMG